MLRKLFVSACIGLGLLSACQPKAEYTELTGEIFYTFYQIKYKSLVDYSEEIDSCFSHFSQSLNPFDSTSLITAINRNRTTDTDSMIRHVWRAATRISEASGGSYDVTCAPLASAWGFSFDRDKFDSVTPRVLDSLRQFVGYQKVQLQGTQLIKQDARTTIDFSSISKGYSSDLVGELLYQKGIQDYMVEIGGEIAWRGRSPRGEAWRIGINKPVEDSLGLFSEIQMILALDLPEGGLATSGNYRNYRLVNGKKVAHTIDPRTGHPLQTDVLSATIIAPSCMLADGLATASMTMSSEDAVHFLAQFEGVEYLLIVGNSPKDGAPSASIKTIESKGLKKFIVKE